MTQLPEAEELDPPEPDMEVSDGRNVSVNTTGHIYT